MANSFATQSMRREKKLTLALLFSVALNIGLLASLAYLPLKERADTIAFAPKPPKDIPPQQDNITLLRTYCATPFPELLLLLENTELVEEGLTKRDLSLACLVSFHHFNLDRALGGLPLQKRHIPFPSADGQETIDLTVFPGLADYQFQAILHYAKTEKYPLTSQGLFHEIKRNSSIPDLLEAFYLCPEFHHVQMLFVRTGLAISKEHLVQLLSQGNWETLNNFATSQKELADFTPDKRRQFLLDYLTLRSPLSAKILLETDLEFILKRLDDTQILTLFDLLPPDSVEIEPFAKALLNSPRTDTVWQRAALALFTLAHEPFPSPYDHALALQRFLPQALPALTPIPPIATAPTPIASAKKHTIAPGDNLWKIARKYHVSIEEIKKVNHLETEKLRPGKTLEIPTHSSK